MCLLSFVSLLSPCSNSVLLHCYYKGLIAFILFLIEYYSLFCLHCYSNMLSLSVENVDSDKWDLVMLDNGIQAYRITDLSIGELGMLVDDFRQKLDILSKTKMMPNLNEYSKINAFFIKSVIKMAFPTQ